MSTKKKILLFTDWYEPGFKAGGPIQSCRNFVAAMGEYFDIYILTSDRDLGDLQPYLGVTTDEWARTKDGRAWIWYSATEKLGPGTIRRLTDFAAPDHIYLNSLYSYRFTLLPLWLKFRGKLPGNVVIAPRGMLHDGALRFKSAKKKFFIGVLNAMGLPRKLVFHATDEQEKKDIARHFPGAGPAVVLANFPKMQEVGWKPLSKRPGELRCIFISRLAPKKNLLFLLTLLKQFPADTTLHLTLRGDIEDRNYWEKCLSAIDALPSHITVSYEGPIPNDAVTGVLQQHHLFVLPTLGENFGHAIFEAFLAGKPVLISDKTPWLGLEEKQIGYDLPLETSAFTLALQNMAAMDQAVYDKWSGSAFEYAGKIQASRVLREGYKELFA